MMYRTHEIVMTTTLLALGAIMMTTLTWAAPPEKAPKPAGDLICMECVELEELEANSVDGTKIINGTVEAEDLADDSVSSDEIAAGAVGLSEINTSEVQARVNGTCAVGSSIREIGSDGTVTCQPSAIATYVFLSKYNAPKTGVDGMDEHCTQDADGYVVPDPVGGYTSSVLPSGDYVAIVSTSTSDIRDILPSGPFFRPDGKIVALTKDDLFDGHIINPINMYSDGETEVNTSVWTGSTENGTKSSYTCSDWISESGDDHGYLGLAGTYNGVLQTDGNWINYSSAPCNTSNRVYCAQLP